MDKRYLNFPKEYFIRPITNGLRIRKGAKLVDVVEVRIGWSMGYGRFPRHEQFFAFSARESLLKTIRRELRKTHKERKK